MNLPDRIRTAIAPAHVRIEQTLFAQQLARGEMSPSVYAMGLRHLLAWHAGLEEAFRRAAAVFPPFGAMYRPESMDRTTAIRRDLEALHSDVTPLCHAKIDQFLEQVERWIAQSPWCLIGVLYVLEGSRMGSMVLTKSLAKALQVSPQPGVGLDYHLDGLASRPGDWQRFKGTLSGLPWSEDQAAEIEQAALACMEALVEIYSALPVGTTAEPLVAVAG